MLKQRRDEVARRSIPVLSAPVDLRSRESFEFLHRYFHRLAVRCNDPFVASNEGRNGDRPRRRESEVVENSTIGDLELCITGTHRPCGLMTLRQAISGMRMLVVAQCNECALSNLSLPLQR